MTNIKLEDIKKFSKEYNSNPINKIIENAITNNGLEKTCLKREILIENQLEMLKQEPIKVPINDSI